MPVERRYFLNMPSRHLRRLDIVIPPDLVERFVAVRHTIRIHLLDSDKQTTTMQTQSKTARP
jgi:hypothetical protein